MSTQTQTNQIHLNKVKEIFQNLKQYLPQDPFDFKELVEQKTECEFWYDENAESSETISIAKNILIKKYKKEFNQLICEDKELTIIFKNSEYLHHLENNTWLLLDYEVEVGEDE